MDIKNQTLGGVGHPVDVAARLAGGRDVLAKRLQVTAAAIGNWKLRGVPPKQCVSIEQLTANIVTRQSLRPDDYLDIWPELAHPTPQEKQAA